MRRTRRLSSWKYRLQLCEDPARPMSSIQYELSVYIVFATLAMLVAGERVVVVLKRPRSPSTIRSADASHGVERSHGAHYAGIQLALRRCSSA